MKRLTVFLVGVIITIGALMVARKPAPTQIGYPLVGMYSNMRSNGAPFSSGGVIDSASCRAQALYDYVILDPERAHPEVPRTLRAMNPHMMLLAYCAGGGYWPPCSPETYGCDTTTTRYSAWRAVGERGTLYLQNGQPMPDAEGIAIDYAQPGVALALADTFAAIVAASGPFSGVFTDGPCSSIAGWWPGNQADYRRSGYETIAGWDSSYRAGTGMLDTRLLQRVSGLCVGNCGPNGPLSFSGWLGENWPNQNPAQDWQTKAQKWAAWDSLLTWADTAYAAPQLSWISTMRDGLPFWSDECQRRFRFGLASATLHDHVVHALVGAPGFDPLRGFMADQFGWEFSVNPDGTPDPTGAHKGWLGVPLGPQRIFWGGTHRRDFKHGTVLVNPTKDAVKLGLADSTLFRIGGASASTIILPAYDAVFLVKKP